MGLSGKQKFLGGLEAEEKETLTKVFDRAARAERFGGPMFGDFMSMGEISLLEQRKGLLPDAEMLLFGGFADAERKMAGFNAAEEDFPIVFIEISGKNISSLTHRDYLGSLMGLGIERCKMGDILVRPSGAVLAAHEDIAGYIINTLSAVGKYPVSLRLMEPGELELEPRSFVDVSGTVASLRLDSITAMLVGRGRNSACDLIRAGRVFVGGICSEKPDVKINDGDVITVRGFGKAIVHVGGRSKKDRIFVTLSKYA